MNLRRSVAGFTLTELIVSMGLLSVVMASMTAVILSMMRGYTAGRDQARADDALRVAEATIATVLRSAAANPRRMTGASAPRLIPDPVTAGSFTALRVVSDFNPPDGDVADQIEDVQVRILADTLLVRWIVGGTEAPVAYPVRTLAFTYYRRNGTAITSSTAVRDSAEQVHVQITAPRHSRSTALIRREQWIYLRNP